jgi:hypothetical protein
MILWIGFRIRIELKCWIRIRIESIRIRKPGYNYVTIAMCLGYILQVVTLCYHSDTSDHVLRLHVSEPLIVLHPAYME